MKVYDASQVTLALFGIPISSGFADGEFCRIEQEGDDFGDVVGTDGEVTRYETNDRRTTVKVILMQSSDGNAALSTINNLDRLAANGAGIGPILIADRQGTSVFAAAECWIAKPPDVVYGREASAREWTIRVANPERFDGGN